MSRSFFGTPDRAVIPVAGLATRMHPLSRVVPKELLPLGRKPVLHRVVEELSLVGVTRFLMITSERTSSIERYFSPDSRLDSALSAAGLPSGWTAGDDHLRNLTFQFARQEIPSGIADAVHRGREFVDGKPFFLHMGDSVITGDPDLLPRMLEAHRRFGAVCSVAVQRLPESGIRARAGVVPLGDPNAEAFEISDIIEKPDPGEIVVPAGLIGRYLISVPIGEPVRLYDTRSSPFGGLGGIFPERSHLEGPVIAVWCGARAELHETGTLDEYLRAQAFFSLRDNKVGPGVQGLQEGVGR